MKICIEGADLETGNMGVSALAVGSIQAALQSYPDAEVSILNYEKSPKTYTLRLGGHQVDVALVNLRFSKSFWLRNNIARLIVEALIVRLIPGKGLRGAWIRRNAWLGHLEEMDVVAAISGGDSFSDIYGLPRLIYVSLPQILALLMRKRVVLLPQTLGPFRGTVARAIARYIIRRVSAVYSRDHLGSHVVESLFGSRRPPVKIRFCNDVAFVLEPRPPARIECDGVSPHQLSDRPIAGVNLSGLLFSKGHQWSNSFGLRVDYRTLVLKVVEFLIREKHANVQLIPHVFGTQGAADPPACEEVYESLKERYAGRVGMLRGSYDQSEIKYVIGKCDFFVGSRMHACIAAVSQCVPAVSIAYSDKFIGVMETVGVESLVADPRKMSEDQILKLVGEGFDHRDDIRRQLERKIPAVQQTVLHLFEEIGGLRPLDRPAVAAAVGNDRS